MILLSIKDEKVSTVQKVARTSESTSTSIYFCMEGDQHSQGVECSTILAGAQYYRQVRLKGEVK